MPQALLSGDQAEIHPAKTNTGVPQGQLLGSAGEKDQPEVEVPQEKSSA